MRRSKTETAVTRQRIVESAATAFRANGIAETGLSDLMATAGLTHGGFYKHFESKDQLIAEACRFALRGIVERAEQKADVQSSPRATEEMVTNYLSARHRDNPSSGCPLAALGSDLRRANEETREVISTGYQHLVKAISSRLVDLSPEDAKARATAIISGMVGGVILARIMNDPEVSDGILNDTRDFLLQA